MKHYNDIKRSALALLCGATLTMTMTNCKSTLSSGIDLGSLCDSISPAEDFYQWATGGWQEANPLKPEHSIYGSFHVVEEENELRLQELIETTDDPQVRRLYASVMDSTRLNSEGLAELRAYLDTPHDKMMRQGVRGLFGVGIGADDKDAKNNIVGLWQGGLTLGQRDYYTEEDSATVAIRLAYEQYIYDLCKRIGYTDAEADATRRDVMRIETRLAKASRMPAQLRDPEANYNKYVYADLKRTFAPFDWDRHLGNLGITLADSDSIIVGQPEAIQEAIAVATEESAEAIDRLMRWHALNMLAACADDETRAINFAFWGKTMRGAEQERPRWKRAVSLVEGVMGEKLGQLYVAKYFPPEAKERMQRLIAHLQEALAQRIEEQDWMSDSTKAVAKDKLAAFYVKVGYPDKWTDYSTLKVTDSYLQNVVLSNEWELDDDVRKHFGKPVDRDEWYMTPQTVNAYYNPTTNEICFPAGILQRPFFDMKADDAFNYGAIGVVIGHEMTHGFDDQGAQYDKEGYLKRWWSQEDTERFEERIGVMREFFDSLEVLPGLYANGSLTLGENMADHGGLMVAYQAFLNATAENPLPEVDGFTPEQRFFIAYAGVWAQNIREAELRKRVKSDTHALARWRVNAQLPHIDAWYEAFGIDETSPMYLPKDKRVTIW